MPASKPLSLRYFQKAAAAVFSPNPAKPEPKRFLLRRELLAVSD
jgi:hypothetical protein